MDMLVTTRRPGLRWLYSLNCFYDAVSQPTTGRLDIVVFPGRMDSVGQQHNEELSPWIDPEGGASEARVTKGASGQFAAS